MRVLVLTGVLAVGAGVSLLSASQADPYTVALQFAATAGEPSFDLPIGRDIVITIRRSTDAKGHHMGWDFSAVDRRLKESPNFFYECRCGHGPRLNDLYAWHFAEAYFPGDRRTLPIYGYPLEVLVRCARCEVTGKGSEARFSAGTVEVGWRRLKESNPRQVGITEMLNQRQE